MDLVTTEEGEHVVTFYLSARYFTFDPEQGEGGEAILALAREQERLAPDYRDELYVTVWVPPSLDKAGAGDGTRQAPLPHVVRIAATPDPRAGH